MDILGIANFIVGLSFFLLWIYVTFREYKFFKSIEDGTIVIRNELERSMKYLEAKIMSAPESFKAAVAPSNATTFRLRQEKSKPSWRS